MKVECFQVADPPSISSEEIANLIGHIIQEESPGLNGEIRFIFVDDDHIQNLNQKYLSHDSPTDVISFALESNGNLLDGEVYISVERASEQAQEYQTDLEGEISRLAIHGTLHLLGYDDDTENGRREMREKEDTYLHRLEPKRKEL